MVVLGDLIVRISDNTNNFIILYKKNYKSKIIIIISPTILFKKNISGEKFIKQQN